MLPHHSRGMSSRPIGSVRPLSSVGQGWDHVRPSNEANGIIRPSWRSIPMVSFSPAGAGGAAARTSVAASVPIARIATTARVCFFFNGVHGNTEGTTWNG